MKFLSTLAVALLMTCAAAFADNSATDTSAENKVEQNTSTNPLTGSKTVTRKSYKKKKTAGGDAEKTVTEKTTTATDGGTTSTTTTEEVTNPSN